MEMLRFAEFWWCMDVALLAGCRGCCTEQGAWGVRGGRREGAPSRQCRWGEVGSHEAVRFQRRRSCPGERQRHQQCRWWQVGAREERRGKQGCCGQGRRREPHVTDGRRREQRVRESEGHRDSQELALKSVSFLYPEKNLYSGCLGSQSVVQFHGWTFWTHWTRKLIEQIFTHNSLVSVSLISCQ